MGINIQCWHDGVCLDSMPWQQHSYKVHEADSVSKGAEGSQGERIVWVQMVLWDSEGSEHHKSLSFGAKLSPEKIASSLYQILELS